MPIPFDLALKIFLPVAVLHALCVYVVFSTKLVDLSISTKQWAYILGYWIGAINFWVFVLLTTGLGSYFYAVSALLLPFFYLGFRSSEFCKKCGNVDNAKTIFAKVEECSECGHKYA